MATTNKMLYFNSFNISLALRGAQALLAVITLGLSGYVASWYHNATLTSAPYQIDFLIFAPAVSILSLVYLEAVPRLLPKYSHPWADLTLQAVNSVFYFGGVVALSVFISKLLFCRGIVCSAARADSVFSGLSFGVWTASAALAVFNAFRARKLPVMLPMTQDKLKEMELEANN